MRFHIFLGSKWYLNDIFLLLNNTVMRFFMVNNNVTRLFGVKWCLMKIFCFNDIKMRHLEIRLLEKCLISYQFVNLKLFHPEQRNFDQTDTRFLDTGISQMIFDTNIFCIWDYLLFQSCPCLVESAWKHLKVLIRAQKVLLYRPQGRSLAVIIVSLTKDSLIWLSALVIRDGFVIAFLRYSLKNKNLELRNLNNKCPSLGGWTLASSSQGRGFESG
jgi:hypothetical protein